ncbi:hypothetical protein MrNuV_ORF065 [Macrobrachium rosenbergii nudivirus]|nr:hypothetical protein MrNuV_ORF065 [Macrobrachium rosenbergii nudivirus]
MNIFSDETNLIRSHYYVSKVKNSDYAIKINFNSTTALYLQKDHRSNIKGLKITHTDFISLLKVLIITYLGIEVENIESLLQNAMRMLYSNKVLIRTDDETNALYTLITTDNTLINTEAYQSNQYDLSLVDVKEFELYPFGKPIVKRTNDKLVKPFTLYEIVKYINLTFKANISALLQNPIICIYNELNYNYTMYRVLKDEQKYISSVLPTVYEYLVADKIVNLLSNGF